MKLSSGKRIGQSGQELRAAASFSFILHGLFFFAAVLLHFAVTPKKYVPPSYQVDLVAQLSEADAPPQAPKPPIEQKVKAPPKPKVKPAPRKEVKAKAKKSDMPDLATQKQEERPEQKPEQAADPPPRQTGEGASVAVKSASGLEKPEFSYYSELVRRKIADNWRHLPVSRDVKVKVVFTILRSGWVDDVRLEEASGIFQFDQAAVRAIRSASPFPPLPEGFFRPFAVFSADLTPE